MRALFADMGKFYDLQDIPGCTPSARPWGELPVLVQGENLLTNACACLALHKIHFYLVFPFPVCPPNKKKCWPLGGWTGNKDMLFMVVNKICFGREAPCTVGSMHYEIEGGK